MRLRVRGVSMSSVRPCRAKGGGFTGNGWVSESFSPSTGDGGTLRYSIGKSGSPVLRSNK